MDRAIPDTENGGGPPACCNIGMRSSSGMLRGSYEECDYYFVTID